MNNIKTWHGYRFAGCNIITQLYYSGSGILVPEVHFYNIDPSEFDKLSQPYIVAVWRIKL